MKYILEKKENFFGWSLGGVHQLPFAITILQSYSSSSIYLLIGVPNQLFYTY
jgi:hypothetical protein